MGEWVAICWFFYWKIPFFSQFLKNSMLLWSKKYFLYLKENIAFYYCVWPHADLFSYKVHFFSIFRKFHIVKWKMSLWLKKFYIRKKPKKISGILFFAWLYGDQYFLKIFFFFNFEILFYLEKILRLKKPFNIYLILCWCLTLRWALHLETKFFSQFLEIFKSKKHIC